MKENTPYHHQQDAPHVCQELLLLPKDKQAVLPVRQDSIVQCMVLLVAGLVKLDHIAMLVPVPVAYVKVGNTAQPEVVAISAILVLILKQVVHNAKFVQVVLLLKKLEALFASIVQVVTIRI